MKPTKVHLFAAASIFLGTFSYAQAQTLHKADNNDGLGATTCWTENLAPTTADNLIWDNTVTIARTISATSGGFYGGFTIQNPGGDVTLRTASSGTSTYSLNNLIDMSAATVNANWNAGNLRIATANFSPTLNVIGGKTLTFDGVINNQGNTKTLTMTGAGNIVFNSNSGGGGALNFNINGANVTMNNVASSWTFGTVTSGKLTLGTEAVLSGKSLTVNSASGLCFSSGVTSASLGSLAGSGSFALADGASAAVSLSVGSNNSGTTYSGVLSGGGSLSKSGTGTMILGVSGQSYSGVTNVSGGTLQFSSSGNTATNLIGTGALNLSNASIVRFASTTSTVFNSALDVGTGGGTLSYHGNQTFSPTAVTGTAALTVQLDNGVTVTPTTFQNFSGSVLVNNGGTGATFRQSGTADIGLINAALNLGAGISMTRNAGTNGTFTTNIGTLSGAATSSIGGSGAGGGTFTFSVGARAEDSIYDGNIVNGGTKSALTKIGIAKLTLTGNNSYTGPTAVNAGTLAVSGSMGETAVAVSNSGSVLSVSGAGVLGSSVAVNANTELDFAVAATAGTQPARSLSGALTFNASSILKLTAGSPPADGVYTLVTATGGISALPGTITLVGITGTVTRANGNTELVLTVGTPGGFSNWITGTFANGTVPGAKQGPNDDPDNDGISNLIEYAVAGLDPTASNAALATISGKTMTVSKRQPLASDITYSIEESTDLGISDIWANVAATEDNMTISYTLPNGPTSDFMRLKVIQP